jgi:protein-disulfide isomerase
LYPSWLHEFSEVPMAPDQGRTRRTGLARWGLQLSVAALATVVGLVLLLGGGDSDHPESPKATEPAPADASTDPAAADDPGLARRLPDDPMALGSVDAPVSIVEYADLRCPFCALYARDTLPALVEQYVDAGLVRYEFRDLPLFGQDSMDAALAARAAGEQGRFWEYFDAVYAAAPKEGHPDMPREKLMRFAEEAGVPDLARFREALDAAEARAAIADDASEAAALGINSVPFFAIDNVAVSGAQPLETFEKIIEDRLAAHGVTADPTGGATPGE